MLLPLIAISCSKDFDSVKDPSYEYIDGRNFRRELDSPYNHLVPTPWKGYPYNKEYGSSLMQFEYPGGWGSTMYGWELFIKNNEATILIYWEEKVIKKVVTKNINWIDDLYEFWVNMLYQVRYPKFRNRTYTVSFDGRKPPYFACYAPNGESINDLYFRGVSPIQGGNTTPAIMVKSAEFVFACAGSGSIYEKDFRSRLQSVLDGEKEEEYWNLRVEIEENGNSNKSFR